MDQWARNQIEALELRVAELERKVAGGAAQSGTAPATASSDHAEVVEHLRNGHEVQAIKAYMDAEGADMTEAKAAVARIAAEKGL